MVSNKKKGVPALVVPHGNIPNVLLLGNGINRAFAGDSWENIIRTMAEKHKVRYDEERFKGMPFNMQIVAATNDNVNASMKELCEKMREMPVSDEQKALTRKMLDLPFRQILTANYTYEIERTVLERKKYTLLLTDEEVNPKTDMMLHRPIRLFCNDEDKFVWHIHGHIGAPNSVIMGHYYYGKLLAKIEKYISYNFLKIYSGCNSHGGNYPAKSWVDYFMMGNVHILGLGMDFTENDLWWLVCCKKRHFPNSRIYFYEPAENISPEKRMMMECYGIIIPELHVVDNDYGGFYERAIECIKENVI